MAKSRANVGLIVAALLAGGSARAMPVLPMTREGSGTAWQPDASPMAAHHFMAGDWMLMLHYALSGGFDWQSGDRGDHKVIGLGWVMGMAEHDLGGGELMLRLMLSPEPLFLGKRGYPLLLQTGEEVDGEPLIDRQHPHDLFMEVAAGWTRPLGDDVAVEVYGAAAGEPALGPVAFAHRAYARYDMVAPLGHHWEDSTHISFGVLTAGILYMKKLKLEGSWFNGREPDEDRYDFDFRTPKSFSGRVSLNPNENWSLQASVGRLDSPEAEAPDVDVTRLTASATWATQTASATLVFGRNSPSQGESSSALLLEGEGAVTEHNILFGRFEWVEKALGPDVSSVFALSIGAVHELPALGGVVFGAGARFTLNLVPEELKAEYGSEAPVGLFVYLEMHPE